MASRLSYIVASTPRTGSYLLCEGLEASGLAGRPTEVFSPNFQGIWCRRWGLSQIPDFADYFHAAVRHGTTPNGVYGLKIHWMHLEKLALQAGFVGRYEDVLDHLFPSSLYIHIVRRDRRAQALSYYRASITNEWWRIEGVVNEQSNGRSPVFHAGTILALENDLARQEGAWNEYFCERNLTPLVVEYEALSADYCAQVARVLSFLGLDSSAAFTIPPPRLVRQSDALSSSWRKLLDNLEAQHD
jgi:LPS sulfotransferase NodH